MNKRADKESLAYIAENVPLYALKRFTAMFEARGAGVESEEEKKYDRFPVDIKTFIESPTMLNKKGVIFPRVMHHLIELNSGKYMEAVLTGSIGCAKTTIALYTIAYQLYLLSCLKNPHAEFGLDPSSEIIFIFQSLNATLSKSVDFNRFKDMIKGAPYFNEHFMYDKHIESKLVFPNRIEVVPVSGTETASIGQNVIGGIIDEVNFMAVVIKSSKAIDGDVYDQAQAIYYSISRRRYSRFSKKGILPGILCLVSSKRYPGQFTDVKTEEAQEEIKKTGKSRIYLYDKRSWDVRPAKDFTGEWFSLFIGDSHRKPRTLTPEEAEEMAVKDGHLITLIPEELRHEFDREIMKALRDIAGISTLTKHPFIMNREAVADCFGRVDSVISRDTVDFVQTKLKIYPNRIKDPHKPRWAHIDLGLTGDSAGLSVGFVDEFVNIPRGKENEILPNIYFDLILEIQPPKGGEILFHRVRSILYKLRDLGMNIKWISLDSWQSVDTIQIMRQKGFITGTQSIDKTVMPYELTKRALYDRRIYAPEHAKALHEINSLEWDTKKGKIDHLPQYSKDVSDSIAGVVYGLTMRKEVWLSYGIDIRHAEQATGVGTEEVAVQPYQGHENL